MMISSPPLSPLALHALSQDSPRPKGHAFLQKVKSFAIAFFKILGSTLLFYANPNFLVLGVFLGLAFPAKAKALIERIQKIWKSSHFLLLALFTTGFLLTLPTGLAGIAVFTGAYWGQYWVEKAHANQERSNE